MFAGEDLMVGHAHQNRDFGVGPDGKPASIYYSNVDAEMEAINRALQIAELYGEKRISIRTDSKFCINAILHYYDKWVDQYGLGKFTEPNRA